MPSDLPRALTASKAAAIACCTSGWFGLPRWPTAAARSEGPTKTPSTPSTEAISVAACRPFLLSICTSTQICSSMPAK
jgi:hypothetical protein